MNKYNPTPTETPQDFEHYYEEKIKGAIEATQKLSENSDGDSMLSFWIKATLGLFFIILCFQSSTTALVITLFFYVCIVLIALICVGTSSGQDMRDLYTRKIVQTIANYACPEWKFKPDKDMTDREHLSKVGLFYFGRSYSSSGLLQRDIDGVNLSLCSVDISGRSGESTIPLFNGTMICATFKQEFEGPHLITSVKSKSLFGNKEYPSDFTEEDTVHSNFPPLRQYYEVYSKNKDQAHKILDEGFSWRLINATRFHDITIEYMLFTGNQVYITIPDEKLFFMPSENPSSEYLQEFVEYLIKQMEILETLDLANTDWSQGWG